MDELLHGVPWSELTAYLVLLILLLWVIKVVISALVKGDIVPAKHAQQWQEIATEQQAILAKLEAQSAEQIRAIGGVRHLVEAALPPRGEGVDNDDN